MIPPETRRIPERRVNPDRRRSGNSSNGQTQVFNTCEACQYLRISRPTFLKLIATGNIHAKKVGKGWRVLAAELERFLLTREMARQ
ncbi:MAG: DNA-binding protein [Deltaproteobacteria bacterium]|nr:MAG: DNA-binding protein [Deltaproteobacteria bacterium]